MAESPVRDATLIGAAQKVGHYEVAPCGTLVAIARQLGHDEALELLLQTLEEERDTDQNPLGRRPAEPACRCRRREEVNPAAAPAR